MWILIRLNCVSDYDDCEDYDDDNLPLPPLSTFQGGLSWGGGIPPLLPHLWLFPRCSLRIISTTLNTVVTCTAWALALLTFRTEQAMLTKKRPTNSSHDTTSEPLPLSPPTPLLSLDNGSPPLQSERNTIATGSFWKLKSRLILEPLSPPMLSSL